MLKLAGELMEGQLAEHIARLDAHTKNPFQLLTIGNYYHSQYCVGYTGSGVALTADKIYAVPFLVARPVSWDRIALRVQAAGAGGTKIRMGLYNDNGSLYPGSPYDDAGTVDVDTTGVKEITIAYSLPRGLYWLVFISDGTPSIYAIGTTSIIDILGFSNPSGGRVGYEKAATYGTLPDPFPASATASYYAWLIGMRVESLD